jgi:hypothetical protein
VSNTNRALSIRCPKCQHAGCTLTVQSVTVIMVTCARCRHMWAAALESLPADIQQKVRIAAYDI